MAGLAALLLPLPLTPHSLLMTPLSQGLLHPWQAGRRHRPCLPTYLPSPPRRAAHRKIVLFSPFFPLFPSAATALRIPRCATSNSSLSLSLFPPLSLSLSLSVSLSPSLSLSLSRQETFPGGQCNGRGVRRGLRRDNGQGRQGGRREGSSLGARKGSYCATKRFPRRSEEI